MDRFAAHKPLHRDSFRGTRPDLRNTLRQGGLGPGESLLSADGCSEWALVPPPGAAGVPAGHRQVPPDLSRGADVPWHPSRRQVDTMVDSYLSGHVVDRRAASALVGRREQALERRGSAALSQ